MRIRVANIWLEKKNEILFKLSSIMITCAVIFNLEQWRYFYSITNIFDVISTISLYPNDSAFVLHEKTRKALIVF